jgi:hypothetical protein
MPWLYPVADILLFVYLVHNIPFIGLYDNITLSLMDEKSINPLFNGWKLISNVLSRWLYA